MSLSDLVRFAHVRPSGTIGVYWALKARWPDGFRSTGESRKALLERARNELPEVRISERTVYTCLGKLVEMGVLRKTKNFYEFV